MSPFELYLILSLDAINRFCTFVGVVSFVFAVGSLIATAAFRYDEDEDSLLAVVPWRRWSIAVFAVASLSATLIPSTRQVAAIYVLSALTQDETVETIKTESGELYELFKAWLRSEIGEEVPAPAGGEEAEP